MLCCGSPTLSRANEIRLIHSTPKNGDQLLVEPCEYEEDKAPNMYAETLYTVDRFGNRTYAAQTTMRNSVSMAIGDDFGSVSGRGIVTSRGGMYSPRQELIPFDIRYHSSILHKRENDIKKQSLIKLCGGGGASLESVSGADVLGASSSPQMSVYHSTSNSGLHRRIKSTNSTVHHHGASGSMMHMTSSPMGRSGVMGGSNYRYNPNYVRMPTVHMSTAGIGGEPVTEVLGGAYNNTEFRTEAVATKPILLTTSGTGKSASVTISKQNSVINNSAAAASGGGLPKKQTFTTSSPQPSTIREEEAIVRQASSSRSSSKSSHGEGGGPPRTLEDPTMATTRVEVLTETVIQDVPPAVVLQDAAEVARVPTISPASPVSSYAPAPTQPLLSPVGSMSFTKLPDVEPLPVEVIPPPKVTVQPVKAPPLPVAKVSSAPQSTSVPSSPAGSTASRIAMFSPKAAPPSPRTRKLDASKIVNNQSVSMSGLKTKDKNAMIDLLEPSHVKDVVRAVNFFREYADADLDADLEVDVLDRDKTVLLWMMLEAVQFQVEGKNQPIPTICAVASQNSVGEIATAKAKQQAEKVQFLIRAVMKPSLEQLQSPNGSHDGAWVAEDIAATSKVLMGTKPPKIVERCGFLPYCFDHWKWSSAVDWAGRDPAGFKSHLRKLIDVMDDCRKSGDKYSSVVRDIESFIC